MKRTLTACSVLVLAACAALGPRADVITVSAVEPLILKVVERHDAYVRADKTLSNADRDLAQIESSSLVYDLEHSADAGTIYVELIANDCLAICARYDKYVALDASIDPIARQTFTRSTMLLRRIIEQAESASSPGGN